jgi:hypothetical protein
MNSKQLVDEFLSEINRAIQTIETVYKRMHPAKALPKSIVIKIDAECFYKLERDEPMDKKGIQKIMDEAKNTETMDQYADRLRSARKASAMSH